MRSSYSIGSWLFGRALGLVLLIAFVSLGIQARGLFGSNGVMPIADLVGSAQRAGHGVLQHPSLFWWSATDATITAVWVVGVIAAVALLAGLVPKPALLLSWVAYLSFVSVGWPFMSFQWDTLLLEASFTAFFFVPCRVWDRPSGHPEPHPLARWALWWLLFRLIFRSGWVKLASGDATWADLTALSFHYWTQPLPTVVAWYANLLPMWIDRLCCVGMFVVELGAPILIGIPRPWARRTAAISIIVLMLMIALTGNYGFFNVLTVVLCLPLLDDRLMHRLVPMRLGDATLPLRREPGPVTRSGVGPVLVMVVSAVIFVTGTFGERPPRWLGPLYPFSTFNNYGLFAVMTTERPEIIIEGTSDGENWAPYVFAYKPGPPSRAPVWVAPHQPRLDWQMWFAALGNYRRNPWLANLMRRLLEGEPTVLELFERNRFEDAPPKQVRALVYHYEFTTPERRAATGHWWRRSDRALYAPILGVPIESGRGQVTPVPPKPQ